MSDRYPQSHSDVASWARLNGVTIEEARQRFAQFVVLCGVASVRSLRNYLVFKGGNALDFVLQPNRSTIDLDFSLDMDGGEALAGATEIQNALTVGIRQVAPRFGMALLLHSVKQQPPGKDKTFITFEARIGYALPDQRQLLIRMANNQTSPHVLAVDVSINEPIFASTTFRVAEGFKCLRISGPSGKSMQPRVGERCPAVACSGDASGCPRRRGGGGHSSRPSPVQPPVRPRPRFRSGAL